MTTPKSLSTNRYKRLNAHDNVNAMTITIT